MRYIITRTSLGSACGTQPHERAVRSNHPSYPHVPRWVIDVEDLHAFMTEVGKEIILSKSGDEVFPYEIEIYDGWRE